MAQIVTKDAQWARRHLYNTKGVREDQRKAQRANRRIEKQRLNVYGEDYVPTGKPRLTGWDII